jgi:hypothetical protein
MDMGFVDGGISGLEQLAKEWNPFASDQPSAVSFLFFLMADS